MALNQEIKCDSSFFIFSRYSWFRIILVRLVSHRHFEKVILTLIILSSLKLVFETYVEEDSILEEKFTTVNYYIEFSTRSHSFWRRSLKSKFKAFSYATTLTFKTLGNTLRFLKRNGRE